MTIVAVTIPKLTDHFKTINDIGWYSAAAGLSLSAFTFFFGKVYTVFPLKHVFVTSVIIFGIGVLLCTVAPNSAVFILGRAICGLGNCGIGNGAITIMSRLLPLQRRPLWFGIIGGLQSVAMISAPLIGGALIDCFTWRACFGINLPLVALAVALITYSIEASPAPDQLTELTLLSRLKSLDLLGTLVIIPSVTCLLLALQWGGTRYGWSSALIISLLVVFGILIVLFSIIQYRSGDGATIPTRIIKNRNMLGGAWFQACSDGTLAVTEYYIAIYFQGVRGFTATKSGALGLPMIIGLMISTLAAGIATSSFGYYTPFMLASTVIAPIPAGILTTLDLQTNLPKILACLGVLGVAIGLGISGPFSACQAVLQQKEIPIGNAILTFGGGVGTALFISASSALFQNRLVAELKEHELTSGNVTLLENVGLSEIRKVVTADRLRDVLLGCGLPLLPK